MTLRPCPEDRGVRLDVFLTRHLAELTRSQIQTLIRNGSVLVENRAEKSGYRVRGDETVEVTQPPPQPSRLEPQDIPIKVVYEDEDLAVVEKPAGLSVHPGAGTGPTTLVNALLFRFGSLSGTVGATRPGIVHRLDKWTSGLLIVAKNDAAHARLSRSFQDREVSKTYIALVHGKPAKTSGDIDLTIARHPRVRTRMSAKPSGGRPARSSYRVLEVLPGFSLLEVKIHTGRTHQIRVHLSAIGHPVAGDDVYGQRRYAEFARNNPGFQRYFLHAAELQFRHPRTGQALSFTSPLPPELLGHLERLRRS